MQVKSQNEIESMELFEFQEYVDAFCAECDLTKRDHRRCLGDLLISAHGRLDLDCVREIATALVNS